MNSERGQAEDARGDEEGVGSYLWDGTGEPDPAVAELEGALGPARWPAGGGRPVRRAPRAGMGWRGALPTLLALAASVALVAGGMWAGWRVQRGTGWRVEAVAGAPDVGGRAVDGAAVVETGDWVRTDAGSKARLRGEGVGTVDVEPDSDLRLVKAAKGEQRLELARGAISAFVTTPPRVFFVNTPAATAVDMGCAYKLRVDETGEGTIYVSLGWVDLQADGREVRVPAGAACRIGARTGPRPGPRTPWFESADPAFVEALERFDQTGEGLDELLAGAGVRDSLTLWHLAAQVSGDTRAKVGARLAELVPPPAGVSVEALDRAGLDKWWAGVRASW